MFQACSWISTNWLPRKQFLHHKAEQLKHRPNLSVFGSPQNAAHISTAVFIQDPRCYEIFYCTPHESMHDVWPVFTHAPKTTKQPANASTNVTLKTHEPVCFGTCQKKRIGSSSRRSITIGVQGTLFQFSASRQTPPAKLLRVSAWECEEILCQKRASKLNEHHWKSHMSGTLPQPEPQDGTKMLRTDSRTEIFQATRTGLVRSPSCSPISWRWKPLAMIASMASHKSFTTWHSTLIQLKTIAKHLALPKLSNLDWKGDEFTCKLTYAYHKLILQKYTEMNYCIIVALPSYTSLNLLELGQNPRFVAWKESDYSLGPLWLIAISAISAIKRRPGMVCSFAGVIFLWLWFNPALGRMWMDLAWLLMWCAVVFYAFFFHWYSRWDENDETCVNAALIRSTFPHSFGATSSLPMSNASHFGLCWPGADKHIEHL